MIEDGAFIGSDTMLVAPVTIGRGSVTGAGSVIAEDVPPTRSPWNAASSATSTGGPPGAGERHGG